MMLRDKMPAVNRRIDYALQHLLLTLCICCSVAFSASAQGVLPVADTATAPKDSLPYMKFPVLPAFNILLTDSTTIFNTFNIPRGKPVALMLFDPDCKHCKALTRKLLESMDSVDNIQFYLLTAAHSLDAIKKFADNFHLSRYKNIMVIGRDYEFFFHDYYGVKFVPDIALYDANKNLIKLFEANATVKDLYTYTH